MPFEKGQSGNPGGRPKAVHRVRELAQAQTENAIACLVGVIEDGDAPAASRVSAASVLLDRGWGKPVQTIGNEDDEGFKIVTRIERVIVGSQD